LYAGSSDAKSRTTVDNKCADAAVNTSPARTAAAGAAAGGGAGGGGGGGDVDDGAFTAMSMLRQSGLVVFGVAALVGLVALCKAAIQCTATGRSLYLVNLQ